MKDKTPGFGFAEIFALSVALFLLVDAIFPSLNLLSMETERIYIKDMCAEVKDYILSFFGN